MSCLSGPEVGFSPSNVSYVLIISLLGDRDSVLRSVAKLGYKMAKLGYKMAKLGYKMAKLSTFSSHGSRTFRHLLPLVTTCYHLLPLVTT